MIKQRLEESKKVSWPHIPGVDEDELRKNNKITLYRGVPSNHPRYMYAVFGVAKPLGGHDNMMKHWYGDTRSVFTSWSIFKSVAFHFATKDGFNGVILTKQFYVWEAYPVMDPNFIDEGEFTIRGTVYGANVEKVSPIKIK